MPFLIVKVLKFICKQYRQSSLNQEMSLALCKAFLWNMAFLTITIEEIMIPPIWINTP